MNSRTPRTLTSNSSAAARRRSGRDILIVAAGLALAMPLLGADLPRRNTSLGNGLFYDQALVVGLGQSAFIGVQDGFGQDGMHPIYVNAYSGPGRSSSVDFSAAWVQDDDSAFASVVTLEQTVAELTQEVNRRRRSGYRPISISGHQRDSSGPRFMTAWIRDDNPSPWTVVVHESAAEYQDTFESLAGQGYRPISVSGYSFFSQPSFAAIFINDGWEGGWTSTHAIAASEYQQYIVQWADRGYTPISLSGYRWGNQTFFTTVLVRDTSGARWAARHGLTQAQLLAQNANWTDPDSNGFDAVFRPTVVAAYENGGGNRRYAAVWQESAPRRFTATGQDNAFNAAFDDQIEAWMRASDICAGSLSIAVDGEMRVWRGYTWAPEGFEVTPRDGRFRIASSSKPFTGTAVQKLLNGVAILSGMKDGTLQHVTLDTPIFMMNGMPSPDDEYGAAAWDVTIRDVLQHRSGWCSFGEPQCAPNTFFALDADLSIAGALGVDVPLDRGQVADYMMDASYWGSTDDVGFNPPGTSFRYSNFGYALLATMIENLNGDVEYEDYVQTELLMPIGAGGMKIGRTQRIGAFADEVTFSAEEAYVTDENTPFGDPITTSAVGGNPDRTTGPYGRSNIRLIDSTGGWTATTLDLMLFLRSFDGYDPDDPTSEAVLLDHEAMDEMWGGRDPDCGDWNDYGLGWFIGEMDDSDGRSVPLYWHKGSLDGASSYLSHRGDRVNVALVFSRNRMPGNIASRLNGLINDVDWPVPCPADLNGDDVVDFADLLIALASWGPCVGCPADIDENGVVDFGDVLEILAAWGPC